MKNTKHIRHTNLNTENFLVAPYIGAPSSDLLLLVY